MPKEDRPGSFVITIRFNRGEDIHYDAIRDSVEPQKFIRALLNGSQPEIKESQADDLGRIADSLEDLISHIKQGGFGGLTLPSKSVEGQEDSDEPSESEGTHLSRKFSNMLADQDTW